MPARHTSHQDSLLLEANDKPEGSGRRKRVSARHQVRRPDRKFRQSSLFPKNGPAEEPGIALLAFFIRCGPSVRNFTGGHSPRWDLPLTCSPTPSFCLPARFAPGDMIPLNLPGRSIGASAAGPAFRQRASGSATSIARSLQAFRTGRIKSGASLVAAMVTALPIARVNQSRRLAKIPVK
jgi:hypothetical protein